MTSTHLDSERYDTNLPVRNEQSLSVKDHLAAVHIYFMGGQPRTMVFSTDLDSSLRGQVASFLPPALHLLLAKDARFLTGFLLQLKHVSLWPPFHHEGHTLKRKREL